MSRSRASRAALYGSRTRRSRPTSPHAPRDPAPAGAQAPGDRGTEAACSDGILLERIHGDSVAALGALQHRYWTSLVCYASVFVDGRDDAEDVVQETFVHVWEARARWAATGVARSYLFRITRNLALNARRHHAAQHGRDERGALDYYARASAAGPDENAEAECLRAEVEAAVATLPRQRRAVFLLSRVDGLTHEEIAQRLGVRLQTVANHMSAALTDLRRALAHHLHES